MKKDPQIKIILKLKNFFQLIRKPHFDKRYLLKVKKMINKNDFNYLEIGSFYGSLTPFLIDKNAKSYFEDKKTRIRGREK